VHASDPAALSGSAAAERTDPRLWIDDDPLLRSIGATPLVPLRRIARSAGGGFELYGKAEFRNPTGSVKDRAALSIVRRALDDGTLAPGRTLLDASSGNTAVAYAMIGARLGFPVELYVPANIRPDRLARLHAHGATVHFTPRDDGTDGAQRAARAAAVAEPARYFYADQYNNPANPDAHYVTTGPEIWRQSRGRITHLVAGIGTGGTISGCSRFLRERSPEIRIVGVEPTGPLHGLEGLKHLPTALRPGTFDPAGVDETVRVETEEAQDGAERLAREEGLSVGPSAGAALVAALRVAARSPGGVIVAVLPDGGRPAGEVPL